VLGVRCPIFSEWLWKPVKTGSACGKQRGRLWTGRFPAGCLAERLGDRRAALVGRPLTNRRYWAPNGVFKVGWRLPSEHFERCVMIAISNLTKQRSRGSCPQVPQAYVLRFPQCPQIEGDFPTQTGRGPDLPESRERAGLLAPASGHGCGPRRAAEEEAHPRLTALRPAHILIRLCAEQRRV